MAISTEKAIGRIILRVLRRGGWKTEEEIAALTGVGKGNAWPSIDRLRRFGLVERVTMAEKARAVLSEKLDQNRILETFYKLSKQEQGSNEQ